MNKDKHAALLGGNWNNGANAGSRYSNWNNAPSNSNNNIGSRGVGDEIFGFFTKLAILYGLRCCPSNNLVSSIHPASANTLRGLKLCGVAICERRRSTLWELNTKTLSTKYAQWKISN